ECERFGRRDFLIRAVPDLPRGGGELLVALPQLIEEAAGPAEDRWQARLLTGVACHAAVHRQRRLEPEEMRRLLGELARTQAPAWRWQRPRKSPRGLLLAALGAARGPRVRAAR